MKKIRKVFLLVTLLFTLVCLAGCKGDESIPRKFNVEFVTNVSTITISPVEVLEGYHITGTDVDLNDMKSLVTGDVIFDGWYSDREFTEKWDVDLYRVTEDTILYAKWTYPTETPQAVSLTDDAFSQTITWVQTGLDENTNVKVYISKAKVETKETIDPNTKEKVTYESTTYSEGIGSLVSGEYSFDGYYGYYKLNETPDGGIYKVTVKSEIASGEKSSEETTGIKFKGTGTKTDPYLVYTENDLIELTTHSYDQNTYAELKADVVLHSVYADKKGCIYDGQFEGNNFTVDLKNNSGMFYELGEHATVTRVRFVGSISGSEPSMGVVANYNSGFISYCESAAVNVSSTGGKANDFSTLKLGGAGGIVGTNKKEGRITKCTITSGQANVISGNIGVGGIAGINYGYIYNFNSTDTPCSAIIGAYNGKELSNVIANSYSGCAVGVNYGTVEKVNVDGKINCRRIDYTESDDIGATNVGGVVGYNAKGGVITECLFQGMRIVGDTNVGGICGYNDGTISNCFTGRRLRKPSATTIEERMFVSPVIGNRNVGGICGVCGENSVITNVFSTANVFSYITKGYSVAEKADNAISINTNQNPRLSSNYYGQTYGVPQSNDLLAPVGTNNLEIDNTNRIGSVEHNLLGALLVNGKNVENGTLIIQYLTILGDKFGYNGTYGISLLWQSENTKAITYYTEGE